MDFTQPDTIAMLIDASGDALDIAIPINTIGVGLTAHTIPEANRHIIDVRNLTTGMSWFYVKGDDAGCSEKVVFHFMVSASKTTGYRYSPAIEITTSGTDKIITYDTTRLSSFYGINYLYLYKVENYNLSAGETVTVNCGLSLDNRRE